MEFIMLIKVFKKKKNFKINLKNYRNNYHFKKKKIQLDINFQRVAADKQREKMVVTDELKKNMIK